MSEKKILAKVASRGYCNGPCMLIKPFRTTWTDRVDNSTIPQESVRFKTAHATMLERLESMIESAKQTLGAKEAEIFEGHYMLLEDEELVGAISTKIVNSSYSAEHAVQETIDEIAAEMAELDEYFQGRIDDFRDLGTQLIATLQGTDWDPLKTIPEPAIIVARELTPSMTLHMDVNKVLGFVTEIGGVTSHVAFIAQNMGIPALVGAVGICAVVRNSQTVIVDAIEGVAIVSPHTKTLAHYKAKQDSYRKTMEVLRQASHEPAITKDGRRIIVAANIGSDADATGAAEIGAEGIGLFRTEFLFMRDKPPNEQEQYNAYRAVAETFEGAPVTIRTLDIGGDKKIPYLNMPNEDNPFLGFRALRMYARHKTLIETQIRAILRASVSNNIRIMVPMPISLIEVRTFVTMVRTIAERLRTEGVTIGDYKLGMMIETPAAGVLSDLFIDEVDFFSIGTNDLTQYMLAVDRGNQHVADLYQPLHPAILRVIRQAIEVADERGKDVSVCGELGGNEQALVVLVGMGLRKVSVAPSKIPLVKNIIRALDYTTLSREVAAMNAIGTLAETLACAERLYQAYVPQ